MPERLEIAAALREIARLLDVKGGDRFRVRGYKGAARALETLEEDLATLLWENRLAEVRGLGPKTAAVVREIFETGRSALLEKLRAETPEGSVELSHVPGMTARRRAVLLEHGIRGVDALEAAAGEGRLRDLPGFGEATERRFVEALDALRRHGGKTLLVHATHAAEGLAAWMAKAPEVSRTAIAGDVRRGLELTSGVDVVVAARTQAAAARRAAAFPAATSARREKGRVVLRLAEGFEARVVLAAPAAFADAV
ncbi:MAG TPA: helix-hairpin-helix domain-containing protein, partial [Planctomycetota bacterium]|nr:helix-hairpin-helix domain-containing protein [Planctomycetota bacterium]